MGKHWPWMALGVISILGYVMWPREGNEGGAVNGREPTEAKRTAEQIDELRFEVRKLKSTVEELERKVRDCDCN